MSKIIFYTYADKRPDFISYQYKSMQHFVENEFELVVFDNSTDKRNSIRINEICEDLNIKCHKINWPIIGNIKRRFRRYAALACAYPIQLTFHKYIKKNKDSICSIIDSDMFFIESFNVEKYINGFDVAAVKQIRSHVNYLWNGIMFFNINHVPDIDSMNFQLGKIDGVSTDVGGHLYYWLKDNPSVKIRDIGNTRKVMECNNNMHTIPKEIINEYLEEYAIEIYDHAILHYGSGSNWKKQSVDYHKNKTAFVFNWIDGAIAGKIKLPNYDNLSPMNIW